MMSVVGSITKIDCTCILTPGPGTRDRDRDRDQGPGPGSRTRDQQDQGPGARTGTKGPGRPGTGTRDQDQGLGLGPKLFHLAECVAPPPGPNLLSPGPASGFLTTTKLCRSAQGPNPWGCKDVGPVSLPAPREIAGVWPRSASA